MMKNLKLTIAPSFKNLPFSGISRADAAQEGSFEFRGVFCIFFLSSGAFSFLPNSFYVIFVQLFNL